MGSFFHPCTGIISKKEFYIGVLNWEAAILLILFIRFLTSLPVLGSFCNVEAAIVLILFIQFLPYLNLVLFAMFLVLNIFFFRTVGP